MNVHVVVRDYRTCDCCDDVKSEVMAVIETSVDTVALIEKLEADRVASAVSHWETAYNRSFESVSAAHVVGVTQEGCYTYRVEEFTVFSDAL